MSGAQRASWALRVLGLIGTFLAITLLWVAVVGIATACFYPPGDKYPPGASADWAAFHNSLVFASSVALAGTFAAATAFAVGGMRRLGLAVICTSSLLIASIAAAAWASLWVAPWLARGQMGYWEFLRLRQTVHALGSATVGCNVPLGAGVGLVLGSIAGYLGNAARRSRRLAIGLVFGLLFAGSMGLVQRLSFGVVLVWGGFLRSWIRDPGMTDPFVPASGAMTGAIAGAILALVALWRAASRRLLDDGPQARPPVGP